MGEEGQTLADTLAELTGADVAASTDPTGQASLGGDWELEHQVGTVEATVATIHFRKGAGFLFTG